MTKDSASPRRTPTLLVMAGVPLFLGAIVMRVNSERLAWPRNQISVNTEVLVRRTGVWNDVAGFVAYLGTGLILLGSHHLCRRAIHSSPPEHEPACDSEAAISKAT